MFVKIGVLKNWQISQENTCVGVFLKCFPVKFAKFLGTPFFNRTLLVAASYFRNSSPLEKDIKEIFLKKNAKEPRSVMSKN